MNLAVKFFKNLSEKPEGIPDSWPAETVELGDSEVLPDDSGDWILMTSEELEDYKNTIQEEYNTWIVSYTTTQQQLKTQMYLESVIEKATLFGNKLIEEASNRNIQLGITQAGKTEAVMNFCHKLIHCLLVGSLYAALSELDALIADTSQTKTDLAPFITNDILNDFKNKILKYLGLI